MQDIVSQPISKVSRCGHLCNSIRRSALYSRSFKFPGNVSSVQKERGKFLSLVSRNHPTTFVYHVIKELWLFLPNTMRKILFYSALLPLLFLSCDPVMPKPDPPAGSHVFGGELNDFGAGLVELSSGEFVLVGGSQDEKKGDYNVMIVKTGSDGAEIASKTIGESNKEEFGKSIALCADGSLIVFALVAEGVDRAQGYMMIKLDQDLNEIWKKEGQFDAFIYNGDMFSCQVYCLPNGGFIVDGSAELQPLLLRFDSQGNLLEEEKYPDDLVNSNGRFFMQRSDGSFFMFAFPRSNSTFTPNLSMRKYDRNGVFEWFSAVFISNPNTRVMGCTELSDGKILLNQYDAGYNRNEIIRFDSTGILETTAEKGSEADYFLMVPHTDGGAILAGYEGAANIYGYQTTSIRIYKADRDGNTVWSTSIGGNENDRPGQLLTTSDGRLAILGQTGSYGNGGTDMFFTFYQE